MQYGTQKCLKILRFWPKSLYFDSPLFAFSKLNPDLSLFMSFIVPTQVATNLHISQQLPTCGTVTLPLILFFHITGTLVLWLAQLRCWLCSPLPSWGVHRPSKLREQTLMDDMRSDIPVTAAHNRNNTDEQEVKLIIFHGSMLTVRRKMCPLAQFLLGITQQSGSRCRQRHVSAFSEPPDMAACASSQSNSNWQEIHLFVGLLRVETANPTCVDVWDPHQLVTLLTRECKSNPSNQLLMQTLGLQLWCSFVVVLKDPIPTKKICKIGSGETRTHEEAWALSGWRKKCPENHCHQKNKTGERICGILWKPFAWLAGNADTHPGFETQGLSQIWVDGIAWTSTAPRRLGNQKSPARSLRTQDLCRTLESQYEIFLNTYGMKKASLVQRSFET